MENAVFVLGIEGADFMDEALSQLSFIHDEGVRVLAPLHYSKNRFGSISFGWRGRIVPREEQTGLTPAGVELVREANRRGILLDLSHCDEKTIFDVLENAGKPVICSHTGPRGLQDFPRYLSDDALKAIAVNGGLIGMWPFYYGGLGVPDLRTFADYARYIASLIGPDHLCIGTDINGVPGNMNGYENLSDVNQLIESLSTAGFTEHELKMIAGENFLRVFETATNITPP